MRRVRRESKKSIRGTKNTREELLPGVWNMQRLPTALCGEALLAENRFIPHGLEGYLALGAALRTDGIVEFARTTRLGPASLSAGLAALRSAQVLLRIEFLFTIGEGERCTAIAARKFLVCHKT